LGDEAVLEPEDAEEPVGEQDGAVVVAGPDEFRAEDVCTLAALAGGVSEDAPATSMPRP